MWGQGGIQSVILDELDEQMPMDRSWRDVSNENSKQAKMEHIGVITDDFELLDYLSRGYWLTNGDSLFNPPPMNGLCKYVSPELYQRHTRLWK